MIFRMIRSSCSFFFVRLLQPFLFANKVIDGDDAAVLVNVDADNSEFLANSGSIPRLGGDSPTLVPVPVPVVRDFAAASGTGNIPTVIEFAVAAAARRDGATGCNAVWFGRTGTECGATTTAAGFSDVAPDTAGADTLPLSATDENDSSCDAAVDIDADAASEIFVANGGSAADLINPVLLGTDENRP